MNSINLKKLKLPDAPGIYFFKKGKSILYIGKATSLRSRVRSYFSKDISKTRGKLIQQMVEEAIMVDYIQTDSVLEALILEANLIKKYQPRHNTKEKDDKSFNYLVITKEDFPRVLVVRGSDLEIKYPSKNIKYLFGPFPQGGLFKEAIKIVRKIFPFRDKCISHRDILKNKPCFNSQIGLCPGVCVGKVSKTEYGRSIRNIKLFFEGKKSSLIKTLEKEMKAYAKKEQFEKAGDIKRTIFALQHIQDISLIKEEFKKPIKKEGDEKGVYRIESYDIAHTGGTHTVGVMTVVENGVVKKSEYRKFNIQEDTHGNDIKALKEVLTRRFNHSEWQNPNLIVVDGGKAQISGVKAVLEQYGYKISTVGVVKDNHHKPKDILGDKKIGRDNEKDILLANYEAHRFAISFHRKKRSSHLG